MFDLTDKVALIVGGAGYLGEPICKGLAAQGANVVIADIAYDRANATAKAGELYKAYRDWCDSNGERPESQKSFGTMLREKGFEKFKKGTFQYHGIMLAEQPTETESWR